MKRMSIVLIFVIIISATSIVLANDLDYLSYWYSDASQISRWTSTPKTWTTVVDGFSSSDFQTYVNHAINEWKNANISTSTASSSSGANIIIRGGTYDALLDYIPTLTSSETGKTRIKVNPEGTYRYNNTTKIGYIVTEAYVYIVYKPGGTSPSTDAYKKTATHELGHALGWDGHSSNSSDVMYGKSHEQKSLTTRDKLHLKQVY